MGTSFYLQRTQGFDSHELPKRIYIDHLSDPASVGLVNNPGSNLARETGVENHRAL
jgi:hypothetical protein